MHNKWAVDQVLVLKPCYKVDRICALFAGRQTITLADVLAMPIPDRDKVWFATRPHVLTPAIRTAWIDQIASRAVTQYALHCGVLAIEQWAAQWIDGTDRTREAADRAAEAAWVEASATASAWSKAAWAMGAAKGAAMKKTTMGAAWATEATA